MNWIEDNKKLNFFHELNFERNKKMNFFMNRLEWVTKKVELSTETPGPRD